MVAGKRFDVFENDFEDSKDSPVYKLTNVAETTLYSQVASYEVSASKIQIGVEKRSPENKGVTVCVCVALQL